MVNALMCTLATEMPSSSGILESYKGTDNTGCAVSKLTSQRRGNNICGISYDDTTCYSTYNTSSVTSFQHTIHESPDLYDCIILCCPNKHHGCDWTGTLTNAIDHVRYDCLHKITLLHKDHTMPVILTMTGFEAKRSNNERWYSPVFCTHEKGYHFRLRVDANGWCGNGDSIAVVVSIVKGDYDDQLQWPFEGVISVQVLNHISNSAHSIVKEFEFSGGGYECQQVTDETQPEYGCWCNKFIMYKSLYYNPVRQSQYLNNDCLLFLVNHRWKS